MKKKIQGYGTKVTTPHLCSQFRNDFDHLVNVDELYPALQFLLAVVPYELRLPASTEKGASTLVGLLNDSSWAQHTKLGLEQPEFPSFQRMIISASGLLRDIEFQTGHVETHRLTDRLDVSMLQRYENTYSTESHFVGLIGNERQFQRRQLGNPYVNRMTDPNKFKDSPCVCTILHNQRICRPWVRPQFAWCPNQYL